MSTRTRALIAALALLPLAQPALAQGDSKPITSKDPSALDIAKTPVTDLNLDSKEIPEVLTRAVKQPYDLTGLNSCAAIGRSVQEIFAAIGPDVDIPKEERDRISAGRVAKWIVSSFIPFRGLIREISGANDREREVRAAIQAGMTRRGFLKGVGASRGCDYPAAPATAEDIAAIEAELDRRDTEEKNGDKDTKVERGEEQGDRTSEGVPIVSQPVVQGQN